jgi:hypothetical protein
MDRRLKRIILPIGLVAAVLVGAFYFRGTQSPRSECVGNGNSDVFACLVPGTDPEHDPSARVGDNCYWTRRLEKKPFEQEANGRALNFKFQVRNFCSDRMQVQMELQPGNVPFNNCPDGVFENQPAVPPNAVVTRNCTTPTIPRGNRLLTREFDFKAGAGLTKWDPEIRVKDAG